MYSNSEYKRLYSDAIERLQAVKKGNWELKAWADCGFLIRNNKVDVSLTPLFKTLEKELNSYIADHDDDYNYISDNLDAGAEFHFLEKKNYGHLDYYYDLQKQIRAYNKKFSLYLSGLDSRYYKRFNCVFRGSCAVELNKYGIKIFDIPQKMREFNTQVLRQKKGRVSIIDKDNNCYLSYRSVLRSTRAYLLSREKKCTN